jgi:antitoxin (DNA-binding transcriptional repressor) of toxin-antitoxin stability system
MKFDLDRTMLTVNIHEAKTHLSRLLDRAAKGELFIIAKAGKPRVTKVPLKTPDAAQIRRPGFMAGQIAVPDDFDGTGEAETERPFGSELLSRLLAVRI